MDASLSLPPSEPRLAAELLEQCRQRSLDLEDQYDGQDVVGNRRYVSGHVGEDKGSRKGNRTERVQRGKITDCRVQDSPCWARCMRAFL